MIDPHKIKKYTQISVAERWKLIEQFAEVIGRHHPFSVIAVVIDKEKSHLARDQYLIAAITKLYQAFDELLKNKKQNGILLFDRANEKIINSHVRKLLGTGSSGVSIPGIRITHVIEDPIFRVSSDSIFIQAADLIAYTLKQMEFPQGSKKKFHANEIFRKKLQAICFNSAFSDADSIIRI